MIDPLDEVLHLADEIRAHRDRGEYVPAALVARLGAAAEILRGPGGWAQPTAEYLRVYRGRTRVVTHGNRWLDADWDGDAHATAELGRLRCHEAWVRVPVDPPEGTGAVGGSPRRDAEAGGDRPDPRRGEQSPIATWLDDDGDGPGPGRWW